MIQNAKLGDRVRVKGHRQHATIKHFYTDIEGGVILDKEIDGFRSWNVHDLVRVEPRKTASGVKQRSGKRR